MRVITGLAKGHKLASLSGNETRPTADRVKEAMFSVIRQHIPGSVTLDLFAGSGALGIEALSGGASRCDFVDQSRAAAEVIRANLAKTRLEGGEVYTVDFRKFLEGCQEKYDLVFLDPPYNKGLCEAALNLLSALELLNKGAIAVCEAFTGEAISSSLFKLNEKKYGTVKIIVFENR